MKVLVTIITLTLFCNGICMVQNIAKAKAKEDLSFFNQIIQSKHPQPDLHFPNLEAYSDSLISVLQEFF